MAFFFSGLECTSEEGDIGQDRIPDASGRGASCPGIVASIRAGLRETGRKPGARGRGYRPGQGLRRVIQLRFREMAKTIAAGPELASGSNS